MRDGRLEASGHNWVEGQGSGPRIDKKEGEEDDQYDAMGNKIDSKKTKKLTSSELRKVRLGVNLVKPCLLTADSLYRRRRSALHAKSEARRSLMMSSDSCLYSLASLVTFTYIMCVVLPLACCSCTVSLLSYNSGIYELSRLVYDEIKL